jgi:hypothetical protein
LTASSAPGPKLPDVSVISAYRGSRVGFGGCLRFTSSWNEVPESHVGIIQPGADELRAFTPQR